MARSDESGRAAGIVTLATVVGVIVAGIGVYLPVADSRDLWPFAPPTCTEAAIQLRPERGPVGGAVEVTGCGFDPATDVAVSVAGREAAAARTDSAGRFDASFPILRNDASKAGTVVTVIAEQGATGKQGSATFTVTSV